MNMPSTLNNHPTGHCVFGPVPSRRLGKSLGINNLPGKACTYSCLYCQVGITRQQSIHRREFFEPGELAEAVHKQLKLLDENHTPDFLTIVPNGEPTLDKNIGKLIRLLKAFRYPVALITNASLLYMDEVKSELEPADFVSMKVDSMIPNTWERINQPHPSLSIQRISEAILDFRKHFSGHFVSETMLVKGLNDTVEELSETASYLSRVAPRTAYISVPMRPPASNKAEIPEGNKIIEAYEIFRGTGLNTELLISYEGNDFASTGNFENDILSITAVHPMRADALHELLGHDARNLKALTEMVNRGMIKNVTYNNNEYYVKNPKPF